MIITTVVATDPGNPTGRVGAMTGTAARRRINVAASRARNQMWVVHSVDPDRFPAGDLRSEFIRHCHNPESLDAEMKDLEGRCESDFERLVLRRILARRYRRLRVQHNVGRYRIDIVIEGPDARLVVECDGDRWHGEDVWHQDRARQQVLERAGWTFERIRGSAFYREPDRALEPLWARLEELGIPTGDEWIVTASKSTVRTVSAERLHHTAVAVADAEPSIDDMGNVEVDGTALQAPAMIADQTPPEPMAPHDDMDTPSPAQAGAHRSASAAGGTSASTRAGRRTIAA